MTKGGHQPRDPGDNGPGPSLGHHDGAPPGAQAPQISHPNRAPYDALGKRRRAEEAASLFERFTDQARRVWC